MSDRIFKLDNPPMKGKDVRVWQGDIKTTFAKMSVDCPIVIDGIYGESTRSYSAALCRASGLTAEKAMAHGVTPELRSKLRNQDLTVAERRIKGSEARRAYRAELRKRWKVRKVSKPVARILEDSWGYHPGVHDGLDVICEPNAPLLAMVKAKVIDARPDSWWGKGAPTDPAVRAKGDGIIQLEVLEDVGPFKKGMHIGYGHAEHATVKVGDIVQAGQIIGKAGLANAWHIHLMMNNNKTARPGVGTIDPRKYLDYTIKNG